jgi:hypothetical protein
LTAATTTPLTALGARSLRRAGAIFLTAASIGLLVQLLFFDTGLGVNFPLTITTLLVAAWFVPERPVRWPARTDMWLPAAAVALAAFVALRGDPTLVALDTLGSLTLTVLAIAAFGGMAVVRRPFLQIVVLGFRVLGSALEGSGAVVRAIRGQMPLARARSGLAPMSGVLRGMLLAVPLVLLFLVLFSSADAVFGQLLKDLLGLDLDLGSLPGRTLTALVGAWVVAGLLVFVSDGAARDRGSGAVQVTRWLGPTEATTVLIVLDLLFVAFVAVQATYLFGGRDTLLDTGLTYAEYARRGFFELLAVAIVVGALVLGLEAFVARRGRGYLAAIVTLIALTVVVLASAFLRLRLYQDAYGWSELRFYVLAAIIWLAIGAMGAAVAVGLNATKWLPHGLVMLSVAFGLAFNLIGPARFIAEQNVARLSDAATLPGASRDLDVFYLAGLGDDALAVIAERDPGRWPAPARQEATELLRIRANELALYDHADEHWQAWNLSRERITGLLSARGLLR